MSSELTLQSIKAFCYPFVVPPHYTLVTPCMYFENSLLYLFIYAYIFRLRHPYPSSSLSPAPKISSPLHDMDNVPMAPWLSDATVCEKFFVEMLYPAWEGRRDER